MAVDSTPWFIGVNGVEHSANVARSLAYAATGGVDGIISASDLRVVAFSTPGNGVRVLPGAASMVNRFGSDLKESYIGRNPTYTNLRIDPTDSSGPRTDLIVARVKDPSYRVYSDWSEARKNDYDYFTFEVVKGVDSGARHISNRDYPNVALARINIPASTATITQNMITDLRMMTNTRTDRQLLRLLPTGDVNMQKNTYRNFPLSNAAILDVPQWATRLTVVTTFSGLEVVGSTGSTQRQVAGMRGVFGNVIDTQNTILTGYVGDRMVAVNASEFSVPAAYRGLKVGFTVQAAHTVGTGILQADYQSTIIYDAQFTEVPE